MSFGDVDRGDRSTAFQQSSGYGQQSAFGRGGYAAASSGYAGYQQPGVPLAPGRAQQDESQVLELIKQINNSNIQIRQLMNQLGTSKDSRELREKLRLLITSTKATAKNAGDQLRVLESASTRAALHEGASAESARLRNQHQKLAKDLQSSLQQFSDVAGNALEKERTSALPVAQVQLYSKASQQGFAAVGDDDDGDERHGLLAASRSQQKQLENEQKFNELLIQDRENDIRAIERDMVEVSEIFTDLSKLVIDQGGLIDNIESNVEVAHVQVETGVVELKKASEYQKSSRTKLCVLALIILIIVGIVVVVVYFKTKG